MSEEQALNERKHCPKCGGRFTHIIDSIYVEYGTWDNDTESRDLDGDADVYRCEDASCNFVFADLTGMTISSEKRE